MADQINVNAIANTLQTKVDLPDGVSQGQCDFVIARKTPTAQDPTWYRLYKSGWIEQGGYYANQYTGTSSGTPSISLIKTMRDTNYYISRTPRWTESQTSDNLWYMGYQTKTVNSFSVKVYGLSYLIGFEWEVKGYAATTGSGEGDESTLGNVYKTYFYMNGKPDYTKGENKTVGTTYTADKNGILEIWTTKQGTGGATTTVTINGVSIDYLVDNYGDGGIYRNINIGDTYSASTSGIIRSIKFFPYDESSQSTDITITTLINAIYPIGSIYIGTTVNCPLASIIGTWEKIDEDLVLQSSSQSHQAGATIAAGLPNITGEWNTGTFPACWNYGEGAKGAIYGVADGGYEGGANRDGIRGYFDASRSNPIYGNSNTVQPPAYVVNIWKRTA